MRWRLHSETLCQNNNHNKTAATQATVTVLCRPPPVLPEKPVISGSERKTGLRRQRREEEEAEELDEHASCEFSHSSLCCLPEPSACLSIHPAVINVSVHLLFIYIQHLSVHPSVHPIQLSHRSCSVSLSPPPPLGLLSTGITGVWHLTWLHLSVHSSTAHLLPATLFLC